MGGECGRWWYWTQNTNQRTLWRLSFQWRTRELWELYTPKLSPVLSVSAPLIAPVHMCLETDIKIVTPLQLVILHCHADTHWSFGMIIISKSWQSQSHVMFQLCVLTLGANAVPIFFGGGGGGGGNNKPKCRYVAQTAYFPTYDTVYKQVENIWKC